MSIIRTGSIVLAITVFPAPGIAPSKTVNKGLFCDWKGNISLEYFMCVYIFSKKILFKKYIF